MQKLDIKKYPHYKDCVELCENYANNYVAFSDTEHRYMNPLKMDTQSLAFVCRSNETNLKIYKNSFKDWRDYDFFKTNMDIAKRAFQARLEEEYKGYVYIQ